MCNAHCAVCYDSKSIIQFVQYSAAMLWSKSVKCPSAPSSLHCSALNSTAQKKLHCSAVHCRKLHCRKMQPGRVVKIVKIGLVGASSCPSVPSLSSLTWGTCGLSYSPVSRASLKLNHNIRIVSSVPYTLPERIFNVILTNTASQSPWTLFSCFDTFQHSSTLL